MKYFFLSLVLAGALIGIAAIRDETGTIRYRNGAVLSFDTSITLKDEDGNWSMNNATLKNLANGLNYNGALLTNIIPIPNFQYPNFSVGTVWGLMTPGGTTVPIVSMGNINDNNNGGVYQDAAGFPAYVRYGTSTSSGSASFLTTSGYVPIVPANDYEIACIFRLQSSCVSNWEFSVGQFIDGVPGTDATFIRFIQGTDAHFQAITSSSGTSTMTDTGVTPVLNYFYSFYIVKRAASVTFYINGTNVAVNTSNITTTTRGRPWIYIKTDDNAQKVFEWYALYATSRYQ